MYLYEDLLKDLDILKAQGAKIITAGKTVWGRDIPCVFMGNPEGGQTFVQGTIHAREYPTTPLLIEMLKNYRGKSGLWCIPMVNIDGAELCQLGVGAIPSEEDKDFLIRVNGGSKNFSQWKANARAVDLNVNFNADWGTGANNVDYPAPSDYIGPYPVSEPEVQSLVLLTEKVMPKITLSYHTKGNVIYWGFNNIKPYPEFSQMFADSTGYGLFESYDSAGGYKDWFVLTTERLGLTLEVGDNDLPTPLPLRVVGELYDRNKNVLALCDSLVNEIS